MTEAKRQWLRKHRPFRFSWLCRGGKRKHLRRYGKHPPCEPYYQWSSVSREVKFYLKLNHGVHQ